MILSIQPGSHQFERPSSIITEGTSRQRTTVASIAIAAAMPMPNCLTVGLPLRTKLEKTKTMISAADVITRALVASPSTTASWLSRSSSW